MRNKGFALPVVLMLSAVAMVLFTQVINRTKPVTTSTMTDSEIQYQKNVTQKAVAIVLSQLANTQPVNTELTIGNYHIRVDTTNTQTLLDINSSSRRELEYFATKYEIDSHWATDLISKRPFSTIREAIDRTSLPAAYSPFLTLHGNEPDTYRISTQTKGPNITLTNSHTYRITLNADKPFLFLE